MHSRHFRCRVAAYLNQAMQVDARPSRRTPAAVCSQRGVGPGEGQDGDHGFGDRDGTGAGGFGVALLFKRRCFGPLSVAPGMPRLQSRST